MKRLYSAVLASLTGCLFLSTTPADAAEVIGAGATWRYHKGKTEASSPDRTTWRQAGYNDSGWATGKAPFYYGEPFVGTELGDMRGNYSSVYLRTTFAVTNPGVLGSFTLNVLSDDGFVVWLNGQEIGRFNVPEEELPANSVSLPALEEPIPYQEITLKDPWKYLVSGDNVLAIHAFNASLNESTDFVLLANASVAEDLTAPALGEVVPPPGSTVDSLVQVEVSFSEPVQGVDAGDLLVNGVPAAAVRSFSSSDYVFGFLPPANGTVEFKWKDDHGIQDVIGTPNAFAGGSWKVTLDPTSAHAKVWISEIMADGDKVLIDDDCDSADWIEIYNSGTTPVNLSGWALTDDANDKRKWRFPDHVLGPDSYLVVFASQKDKTVMPRVATACRTRANALASFHTNFRLSADGEYLALVDPSGDVISEFSPKYPKQTRDVSYGRIPGAGEKFGYFSVPTPRLANSSSGAGFSGGVNFSRQGGTILSPFDLTLTAVDTNAVIKFTIDGTLPAETNKNLLTYTASVRITNTMQVRARAFTPGLLPGPITSETYVLLTNSAPHLNSFTSSLPIIVMTSLKRVTFANGGKNTMVQFSLYEPKNGLASLRRPPDLTTRAGIKRRGSSTGDQPQANFALDIWDEFDQDRDVELLGMPEDSEWVMYAPSGFDPTLLHNAFTMEVSRQMDFLAPRTRFVEVYLNMGGQLNSNQWHGVYVLMEKPGLSKGRVPEPKAAPEDLEFPEVTGSYMFKTDRLDEGDVGFSAGGALNAYVEPKEREMRSPQRAPQLAYLTKFWRDLDAAMKLSNPNLRHPVLGYRGYLDVTNWMDFHLLETLSGQVDAIRLSTYFYKPRNGKLMYGPRWDYDRAWESKDDGRDDNPRVWDTGGGLFGNPWWGVILKDADAWQVWADRWALHRKGPISLTNMYAVINHMTNQLRWSQPREAKRWTETTPRGSYSNEIRIMKTWISNRVSWIDLQFASAPVLSSKDAVVTPGFKLTLSLPQRISSPTNVVIYYTLDGTDPRPVGGTGVISSFEYTGPITITTNTRVLARLRDKGRIQRGTPTTTVWSAPEAATFVVTPPPLILTELMYHPAKPLGSVYAESDFEFLELKNISDRTLDLKGYHFTAGIDYLFTAASGVTSLAPGGRVLLVKNLAAFQSRYPGVNGIAGEFTGSLDDSGERIALAGPVEEPIFDFSYKDSWYRMADGPGFSMVLVNENSSVAGLGAESAWRLSAVPGGSPGTVDGAPLIVPRVVVNEVLVRTTAVNGESQVELANLEDTTADVSGWWVSDSFSEPQKVRLPAGTRIQRKGFVVVREGVFNLDNGAGFGLSLKGDDFWLFSADREGALTGYYHGLSFGPSEPGQSFGRHIASNGSEEVRLQRVPSLGAANVGPQVGPVVFSEIFFQPPSAATAGDSGNTLDEFVELWNSGPSLVALFDTAHATNTWRIRGGIDFNFPRNFALPPGGRVLLVGFDPVLEPSLLESLQRRAGLDPATPVLGPWRGILGNGSDTVRLERPSTPVVDPTTGSTSLSHITLEEVAYNDHAPWPHNTSATGWSLVRRNPTLYGDEPLAWGSAPRTAVGTDADADGLPDLWEVPNGFSVGSAEGEDGPNGDPDSDGFTNRQEWINGTNPRDATSALQLGVTYGPGQTLNLMLAAPAGRKFRVESSPAVGAPAWSTVREVQVSASGVVLLDTQNVASEGQYFRVLTLPE